MITPLLIVLIVEVAILIGLSLREKAPTLTKDSIESALGYMQKGKAQFLEGKTDKEKFEEANEIGDLL